jgi:OmpA-OmpF porin, OOP family
MRATVRLAAQIRRVAKLTAVSIGALVVALPSFGQRKIHEEMPGAKDHRLLSRYAGSVLVASSQPLFEQMLIPMGPGELVPSGYEFRKSISTEGTLTGHFYVAPMERSALEVFRNYEQALRAGGFKLLYQCEMRACEKALVDRLSRDQMTLPRWPASFSRNPRGPFERDIRFLSAEYRQGARMAYVQLYVAEPDSIWQAPVIMQLVIEPKAMDEGRVLVDVSGLKQALGTEGRVALYGLTFETGKADIRAESKAQLSEMSTVLKAEPSLRVAIVGHTDTEGTVEGNLRLSQARAEAVVQALVREHGVAAARLDAKGVAAYAPVASNATPEGRAKNRRVEMVQR